MAQRWLIVQSEAAGARRGNHHQARPREEAAITRPRFHRQATRFQTPEVAQDALAALATRWTYPQVDSSTLIAHTRDASKGRPTAAPPERLSQGKSRARVRPDQEVLRPHQHVKAGVGQHP